MKKDLTVIINGKSYPIKYAKDGNAYRVETNHDDLKPHVTDNFTFHIINGQANYLVISDKTHEIARQIIIQINKNEFK